MTIDADVIVVGLGVGEEFVAGRLAEAGLGVVGIESALVGGECPYWGCVPSKMIIGRRIPLPRRDGSASWREMPSPRSNP
jgi:pyruvate/2-oxoglutarate dehydrogenase complex dihydrolipoamide dehydrogenase (E3) component